MSVFDRFEPRLQHAIVSRLGWRSLRPVQEQAGEAVLDGRNAVILAPTAGGKTEAAIFPVLSQLLQTTATGVSALYVAPIKALLNNQAERLGLYTEMVGLRRFVWHGDISSSARQRFVKEPAELLMTTPESLEVMLISRRVPDLFGRLQAVIIDEVHALAGTDRGAHLMSVLERVAAQSVHDVQRSGLSATVGNPAAILEWLRGSSQRPGAVVDPPAKPARRRVLVVRNEDDREMARDASAVARGHKSLFFCQSRSTSEAVAERLSRHGTNVFVHHSSVSKEERLAAEEQFQRGSDACIVCTSTLELGIDVGDLDKVFQAEAPSTVSSFLQRMGRTGRRDGQVANTTFFCLGDETVLQASALIELARDRWVESVRVTDRCWPVLLHQVLALALAHDGISPDAAWSHLSRVPDFAGIHRAEFDRLMAWLIRDQGLDLHSGRLLLGPKTERLFGRRNFMKLYAVFSSPATYAVLTTAEQPIGTLEQDFIDQLIEGASCFLLGGRAWVPVRVDHDLRRLYAEPAPRGKEPTWKGYLPNFVGFEICQRIRTLLMSTSDPPYLHESARAALARSRDTYGDVLRLGQAIEYDDGEIRWWTFAGGRINNTLRYALRACNADWTVVPSNFELSIRGPDLSRHAFDEALARIETVEFWEDEALWRDIAADLPNYRLSKFQPLMPPWVVREMVAGFLLDMEGAWSWLNGTAARPRTPDLEAVAPPAEPAPAFPVPKGSEPQLPYRWVADQADLERTCAALRAFPAIGLDVETTLYEHALCLIQIGTPTETLLIDPFEFSDFAPLAELMADTNVCKVIHTQFEVGVMRAHEMPIRCFADTCKLSKQLRGDVPGNHNLRAVCRRELGIELDKSSQTSDWRRRPLTDAQVRYAALDAEVLLPLYDRFAADMPPDLFDAAPT